MRDNRIELYRCLLTWGIVVLHVVGFYAAGAMRWMQDEVLEVVADL